jgi:hypothetical protein
MAAMRPHAWISASSASPTQMPLWTTSPPSLRLAIVMTRFIGMFGSAPSTRHTCSESLSMGPCGNTFQVECTFAMRAL